MNLGTISYQNKEELLWNVLEKYLPLRNDIGDAMEAQAKKITH